MENQTPNAAAETKCIFCGDVHGGRCPAAQVFYSNGKARLSQQDHLAKRLRELPKAELVARLSRSVRIHSAAGEPKAAIINAIVDAELPLSRKERAALGL